MASETSNEIARAEYKRALEYASYNSIDAPLVNAAAEALLPPDADRTDGMAWLEALTAVRIKCPRCMGSGVYGTRVENGRMAGGNGGPCFRCNGSGAQGLKDWRRNYWYDNRAMARALAADFAPVRPDDA